MAAMGFDLSATQSCWFKILTELKNMLCT